MYNIVDLTPVSYGPGVFLYGGSAWTRFFRPQISSSVSYAQEVFAIVIIFKIMLSKSSFNTFVRALKKQLDVLNKALTTINITAVTDAMGLPANWEDIQTI